MSVVKGACPLGPTIPELVWGEKPTILNPKLGIYITTHGLIRPSVVISRTIMCYHLLPK